MQDDSRTIHRTVDEARGGESPNIVRWVLGISLSAAIIALSVIWITGAVSQNDTEDEANVANRQLEQQDGPSTDSIVVPTGDPATASPAGN